MSDIAIPDKFKDAAKEIIAICKRIGAEHVFVNIRPRCIIGEWRHDVIVEWHHGRHGEEENRIKVSSKIDLECVVKEKP